MLRQLVKLSERKEALLAQIQDVDRQMLRLQNKCGVPMMGGDRAGAASRKSPAGTRGRRARRGALKEKIVSFLKRAGARGAHIREMSEKLKVRPANLYVWFNGTGKNVRGLKKVGPAKYRLS
jgi:hypothetical protein